MGLALGTANKIELIIHVSSIPVDDTFDRDPVSIIFSCLHTCSGFSSSALTFDPIHSRIFRSSRCMLPALVHRTHVWRLAIALNSQWMRTFDQLISVVFIYCDTWTSVCETLAKLPSVESHKETERDAVLMRSLCELNFVIKLIPFNWFQSQQRSQMIGRGMQTGVHRFISMQSTGACVLNQIVR